MFDYELFLGLPLTQDYEARLSRVPSVQLEFYIQNDPNYLQSYKVDGVAYLGKAMGVSLSVNSIELQKSHIFSLLKRLVPDYPYDFNSLTIVAKDVSGN